MGYVSTWMGDYFSALPVSVMALWLKIVDQNLLLALFLGELTSHATHHDRLFLVQRKPLYTRWSIFCTINCWISDSNYQLSHSGIMYRV